jgi:hypothetical protein
MAVAPAAFKIHISIYFEKDDYIVALHNKDAPIGCADARGVSEAPTRKTPLW